MTARTGETVYQTTCAVCHAANGFAASGEPDLAAKDSLVAAKLAAGRFSNLATTGFEQSPAQTIKASLGYAGGTCSTASCHGRESW